MKIMINKVICNIVVIPHKPYYVGKYDNVCYGDAGYEKVIFVVIIIIIACIAGYLYGFKK